MKYDGEWRFLSEQGNFYYGSLEYDKGTEIILEIFDDPIHSLSTHRADVQCEIIILGKLDNGQKVTLRNCTVLSSRPYLDHFRITRIESQYAMIGENYEKIELEFDAIIVTFSNLNSFISYNSLSYDSLSSLNQNTNKYERELEILDNCKISIFPESSSFSRNNRILFKIQSLKGKYFDDYIELKSTLQDFLNFITSSEILIDKIDVVSNSLVSSIVYHSQHPVEQKQNKRVLFKPNCKSILFTYPTISPRLGKLLGNWYKIAKDLEQVYDLYFAVVYHSDQYDIYRFLMLTTALEVYHGLILDTSSETKKKNNYIIKNYLLKYWQNFRAEICMNRQNFRAEICMNCLKF